MLRYNIWLFDEDGAVIEGLIEGPILGPRWLDLYQAADTLMQRFGNPDHRFIERFRPGSDAAGLVLETGS